MKHPQTAKDKLEFENSKKLFAGIFLGENLFSKPVEVFWKSDLEYYEIGNKQNWLKEPIMNKLKIRGKKQKNFAEKNDNYFLLFSNFTPSKVAKLTFSFLELSLAVYVILLKHLLMLFF